jgi:hypothetical protein
MKICLTVPGAGGGCTRGRVTSVVADAKTARAVGPSGEANAAIAASLNAAAESNEGPSNPAFQATMFSCMYQTLTGAGGGCTRGRVTSVVADAKTARAVGPSGEAKSKSKTSRRTATRLRHRRQHRQDSAAR